MAGLVFSFTEISYSTHFLSTADLVIDLDALRCIWIVSQNFLNIKAFCGPRKTK